MFSQTTLFRKRQSLHPRVTLSKGYFDAVAGAPLLSTSDRVEVSYFIIHPSYFLSRHLCSISLIRENPLHPCYLFLILGSCNIVPRIWNTWMITTDEIRLLFEERQILSTKDLAKLGIPRIYLTRMVRQGILQRAGTGIYTLPDVDATENHSLALVQRQISGGVICLLSALQFYDLTTQLPSMVWLAIHRKSWQPERQGLPIQFVWFSEASLTAGVETHIVEGVNVNVFSVAKTIADCFKYRNKIGLDVAIEALRDAWKKHLVTPDDLWKYSKICRVTNVMRPYMESLQ
jgi:hypothetical protein